MQPGAQHAHTVQCVGHAAACLGHLPRVTGKNAPSVGAVAHTCRSLGGNNTGAVSRPGNVQGNVFQFSVLIQRRYGFFPVYGEDPVRKGGFFTEPNVFDAEMSDLQFHVLKSLLLYARLKGPLH